MKYSCLWSPPAPVWGPLKNTRLLLKPIGPICWPRFSLCLSQTCWVGSCSNSSKSFYQYEINRANRLYLPQVIVLRNLKHKFKSIYRLSAEYWAYNPNSTNEAICSLSSLQQRDLQGRVTLWGNKVWKSSSKTSIKSVKLYNGGFILIHRCCLELISLSSPFCLSCLFLCACVPAHKCVSIAKNINFTNISPRLLNTSNPLCCALSCYGG